ncbi:hypothetical protein HW115_05325 [Verrucomicrobiaceae bacterium N1E253]|uniref:Uncharacterized protein n=1 Tax=Oceaniferula marina TaxID=2748318 RepID=A0A851GCW2_9BACT|nr:hypothetical protein [Oceaniferula marina]NWK55019.1 hypothetical protein [Oceaniferula marina]
MQDWDGYAQAPKSAPLKLGKHQPDGNLIKIQFVVTGKNKKSSNTFLGMDCIVLE